MTGKPKITEAQLSHQVQDFLGIYGWRVFKQEPLSRAGGGRYAGELGMPDLLAIRYDAKLYHANLCEYIWIEVKAKGRKPAPHQDEWHARERALGAEVWVVDDFDVFRERYLASGLGHDRAWGV
jgi:hypothetical protein